MKIVKAVWIIAAVIAALLCIIYANHKMRLKQEAALLSPLGEIVEVDGKRMSVYIEGTGDKTLVFMSGGGTCSPILDFKSLYSLLCDDYKVVVVEKFGYGFSDVVDKERDIDSILSDTRAALAAAGLEAPYILCPHSMSGLEALHWAQKYPDDAGRSGKRYDTARYIDDRGKRNLQGSFLPPYSNGHHDKRDGSRKGKCQNG